LAEIKLERLGTREPVISNLRKQGEAMRFLCIYKPAAKEGKVAADGETEIRRLYEHPQSNAYPTFISNPKRTKNAIHGHR
jgi:hypothetical protein